MTASFPDHFSSVAANYARFRPTYPDTIFEWIATTAPATGGLLAAWTYGIPFIAGLREQWGEGARDVRWPVTMLAGRV